MEICILSSSPTPCLQQWIHPSAVISMFEIKSNNQPCHFMSFPSLSCSELGQIRLSTSSCSWIADKLQRRRRQWNHKKSWRHELQICTDCLLRMKNAVYKNFRRPSKFMKIIVSQFFNDVTVSLFQLNLFSSICRFRSSAPFSICAAWWLRLIRQEVKGKLQDWRDQA